MSKRTQAFVNFYAAMGTLHAFAKLDEEARNLAKLQDLTLRFKVKDGPDGKLTFNKGEIFAEPFTSADRADIVLLCGDCEKFNKVVDGTAMPLPIKGLFKVLKFMMKPDQPFNVLTSKMAAIMRLKEYSSEEEKKLSTILAFNAMAAGLAQIANEDKIGKMSAARIPEGEIRLAIEGSCELCLLAKKDDKGQLRLTFQPYAAKNPRSQMVFGDIDTANGLINGRLDAMSCIANGTLQMKGFIPQLQNLNNILNIVPKYLA